MQELLQEQEQTMDQQQQNINGACGGGGGYNVFGSRKITTDDMDYASGRLLQLRYIYRLSPELQTYQIVKEILNEWMKKTLIIAGENSTADALAHLVTTITGVKILHFPKAFNDVPKIVMPYFIGVVTFVDIMSEKTFCSIHGTG